ncbi:hypothetical protein WMY93_001923 [Mugilogobius chulae]|uniref:Uncharacterized protein n=1 Tax=Mugilogobius chulae TaxID=88201 RepID=A0AAW0PVP0_9GOBI
MYRGRSAPAPGPAPAPAGRWERLKQSKAGVWCRSLLSDYKEACREVVVGAKERPLKASVYVGLLGGVYACFSTRPDQSSFQATLLDRSNQLALLSPGSETPRPTCTPPAPREPGRGVSGVQRRLRPPERAVRGHLLQPVRALEGAAQRVLDVGFAGRWWVLDKKMEDFDVNDSEYKHLPAHMQATAPPSVQEVERNEKLHKASWLPIIVQEEKETTQSRTEDTTAKETQARTEDTAEETRARTEDTAEETQARTEDTTEETRARTEDTAEETQTRIEEAKMDILESLDIKEQEDLIEDSFAPPTLDVKEETHVQTEDSSALETVDATEEAEDMTVYSEKDIINVVELMQEDTVVTETLETAEDGASEEEKTEQAEAQTLKN